MDVLFEWAAEPVVIDDRRLVIHSHPVETSRSVRAATYEATTLGFKFSNGVMECPPKGGSLCSVSTPL
jgi:hypothetical protein